MKLTYKFEKYKPWISQDLISLDRKLVSETAFDGIVKIYSMKSKNVLINNLLVNKLFGDFVHYANCGVFLRMFESKTSWPETILVYIDFAENYLVEIQKTNSSWNLWDGIDLGFGKHTIGISPDERIDYLIAR